MSLNYWLENVNEEERKELEGLSEEELNDRFYTKLDFGTAGMRGVLGIGENRMNVYQIRRVCDGYSKWLLSEYEVPSVAISYDNRRMSKEFANEASRIFSSYGIKTYLSSNLRPTPYLSYAVRELNCTGGVMITASHNPKDNNGIKLYDETGCQYTPTRIKPIVESIKNSDYFKLNGEARPELISDYIDILDEKYINDVLSVRLNPELDLSDVKAIFTPLHGTTSTVIERIIPSIEVVKEQMINDTEFPTLDLPNPEDKRVFEMALGLAKEDTDILLATDPDGDRLGTMVKHNGEFVYLTGNEISSIVLAYVLENHHDLDKNKIVFKSIVTSTLGDKLCEKYGVTMRHILTGFKYVGDGITHLAPGESFLFGYEESNGCLVKEFVRDKDSLQAVLILVEACKYYKDQGKTLIDVLNGLYKEFGYHLNSTLSYAFAGETGVSKMKDFVNYFRNNKVEGEVSKLDFLKQDKFDKTDMIFINTNYGSLIVRPSGTEPKIKVYTEIVISDKESALAKLEEIKAQINTVIEGL